MDRPKPPAGPDAPPPCEHGNVGACGFCMAKDAPRCKHGKPWYCGFCLAETGEGRVSRGEAPHA